MDRVKNKRKQKLKEKTPFLFSGYFLVITVCFIIPLVQFKSTIDPVTFPRLTALGFTVIILSILMFFENGKKKVGISIIKNGSIATFLLFILISIASLFIAVNPFEGLFDVFKWVLVLLLTLLGTYLLVSSEKSFYILLKGVIISAIVFSINGIIQYFENTYLNTDPNALYAVKGTMAHKNQFSISLFMMMPFLLSGVVTMKKYWKKLAVFAFILTLMVILILQTRSVWLGILLAGVSTTIVFFIVNSKNRIIQVNKTIQKRLLIGGISLIALTLVLVFVFPVGPLKNINHRINTVFNPNYTSNEWRIEMWNATSQLAQDNLLAGVGAGNWKISVYPYYSEYLPSIYRHWLNPHNDYLLVFSEKGLLGLIGFISIFIVLIYYGIRNARRSDSIKPMLINFFFVFGIIGYMVISFFSFPNERINHLNFMSLMAAVLLSNYLKQDIDLDNTGFQKGWLFLPAMILSYLAIHFGIIAVNSEINIAKAQLAQKKKDWNKMEVYAQKGYSIFAPIESKHSFPVAMYTGVAKYSKGEYRDALTYFEKSYQQHPTNVSVMNNLGCVYDVIQVPDSSIVYYSKTLEIFPHYEIGQLNLAKAFYFKKDFENSYKTILLCDPKSANQEIHKLKRFLEKKLNKVK